MQRTGARNVFLTGWRDHASLPDFLNATDAQVLGSVREQFGLVLVEGMACGLPAIGVNRLGPGEIIDDGATGWLVEPDDLEQLTEAIVSVCDGDSERLARGCAAREAAVLRWGWPALASQMAQALDETARRPNWLLDQSQPKALRDRRGAVTHAELLKDVLHVSRNRGRTHG